MRIYYTSKSVRKPALLSRGFKASKGKFEKIEANMPNHRSGGKC